MKFLDPSGRTDTNIAPTAPRLAGVKGMRLALLDNGKTNAEKYLNMIGDLLTQRYGVGSIKMFHKAALSKPAPEETLAAIVAESDFAVTGIGDCGSCSTNSVHDGVELERLGIPAVAVCTEAFRLGLDVLTNMRGMPDYRYAIVPHPLGVLFEDELFQRALLAAPQIVEIVTGKPAEVIQ